jgi:hypothetical protein
VKQLKYFSIFMILSLLGFYIGSQSEISGQGLFFAEVEDRGPASPETELEKFFSQRSSTRENDIISMTSVEGVDYCELIEGVDKYELVLTAEGVKSGDLNVQISLRGDCDTQRSLVIFDASICDMTRPYEAFKRGFYGHNEVVIQGRNLDMSIPMRALTYFISSLEITYDDEKKETVEPSLDEVKMLYSCKESFPREDSY